MFVTLKSIETDLKMEKLKPFDLNAYQLSLQTIEQLLNSMNTRFGRYAIKQNIRQ